ncbi:MAG: hypothetical protein J2P58_13745, partial [Acidimicrobiaceae bacterium]|nr:hypothetical protein [Acidimicrobiaceae bacterium]
MLLLVGYAAFLAVRLTYAANQLRDGVRAAGSLNAALHESDLEHSTAGNTLAKAAADFAAAHATYDSAWLEPLRAIRNVGRQIRAVDELSGAAAALTGSGRAGLGEIQATLAEPQRTPLERQAVIRGLAGILTGLDRSVHRVDLGPSRSLWASIAKRRNTFATEVVALRGSLDKGAAAARAVADLLDGHRRYLILSASNAEMRDGAGMYLQAGTATSSAGRVTAGSFAPTADLVSGGPALQAVGDLAARWGKLGLGSDYRKLG